jgi:hypothetical protein
MGALKSLSFVAIPKTTNADPALRRRAKLIDRLEEQRALLQNPSVTRSVRKTVKENGEKRRVDKAVRIRPWWQTDLAGNTVLAVRYGAKPIEFEKGKNGIIVQSPDKLPSIIETLITAVRQGELDEFLAGASKTKMAPKTRKAA